MPSSISALLCLFLLVSTCTFGRCSCPCEFPPYRDPNAPFNAPVNSSSHTHTLPQTLTICTHSRHRDVLAPLLDITEASPSGRYAEDTVLFLEDLSAQRTTVCDALLSVSLSAAPAASAAFNAMLTQPRACPEGCGAIPEISIPLFLLEMDPSSPAAGESSFAVTCSLTLQDQLLPKWKRLTHTHTHTHAHTHTHTHAQRRLATNWARFLLHEAAQRVFYECRETAALRRFAAPSLTHVLTNNPTQSTTSPHSSSSSSSSHSAGKGRNAIHRRKIEALVIWIGTSDRISMVHAQTRTLNNTLSHTHTRNAVVPWVATDILYPCHPASIRCTGNFRRFGGLLPGSAVNYMSAGWGCAQRRPLRALSHALLFFDPQYVVLLDDDTFFNFPLFQRTVRLFVLQNMTSEPIYLGEALGRTGPNGHLSTLGMFVGGSGYVIGKALLDRLMAREIARFAGEGEAVVADRFRTAKHIEKLGVLQEGLENAQADCEKLSSSVFDSSARERGSDTANACVLDHPLLLKAFQQQRKTSPSPYDALSPDSHARRVDSIPLAVRLVDLCANLMAGEHTCQHSDHSLGRCLLYGAAATPLLTACVNQSPGERRERERVGGDDLFFGMCFNTPQCDLTDKLTCHRYQPDERGQPVRTSRSNGYYKKHSSFFNGEIVDT